MSADAPLVSAVIIFLNGVKFLTEAIESVFDQTYQHWELILVDDGSTDGSTLIAKRLAEQHPGRVQYLEHPHHANLGMSASRNAGINAAKGVLVALLDSDDVWVPDKLNDQIAIFQAHPGVQMVYGNNLFWHSWNENSKQQDYKLNQGAIVDTVFDPTQLLLHYFRPLKAAMPVPSDLVFSRDMAVQRGGFDAGFRNMYEEHPFLLKVFAHEPVFVSSRCWTRYRQHEESTVASWQQTNLPGHGVSALLRWTEDFLRASGFEGTEVWRAMEKSRFRFKHPLLFRWATKIRALKKRKES